MRKFITTLNKRQKAGYIVFLSGWVFNLIETAYFGWNLKSQSRPEDICDGISCALWIVGTVVLWHGILIPNMKNWRKRIADAYRLLFSKSYMLYYTKGKSFVHYDSLTIEQLATLGKVLIQYTDEEIEQGAALNEANKILGN